MLRREGFRGQWPFIGSLIKKAKAQKRLRQGIWGCDKSPKATAYRMEGNRILFRFSGGGIKLKKRQAGSIWQADPKPIYFILWTILFEGEDINYAGH